jgi:ketosteroid isomerase-like protein
MIAASIFAGLLIFSSLAAQTSARESSSQADLRKSMAERTKANIEGDTETIERLMADDYVQTDVLGHVQNKSEWLNQYFKPLAALIQAGKFRWEIYQEKDVQVRDFGDTAVVTGSLTLKPSGAIPVPGRGWVESSQDVPARTLRFTRVFVKRNGGWLLAALHNAWLPEEVNRK